MMRIILNGPFVLAVLSLMAPIPERESTRAIQTDLMAPCCWSQTVADHSSPVALEMREEIDRMLREGRNRQEILQHYVARYGERILSRPPAHGFSLLAYLVPGFFLILGVSVLTLYLRRHRRRVEDAQGGELLGAGAEAYREQVEREMRSGAAGQEW